MLGLLFDAAGQTIADEIAEFKNQIIFDAVVSQGALTAAAQDARLHHDFEVLGDIGLTGVGGFYQVLHTFFAISK